MSPGSYGPAKCSVKIIPSLPIHNSVKVVWIFEIVIIIMIVIIFLVVCRMIAVVNFRYCEKATKFEKMSRHFFEII